MSAERPAARGVPAADQEWLTLGQAARFLGVAQSTVRKWSDQGRIPAFYTPGGHRRFRRVHLETFVDSSGPAGRRSGPLVLLVDDDGRLRQVLRLGLELAGYSVREADSGEAALAAINEQAPELVLLDVVHARHRRLGAPAAPAGSSTATIPIDNVRGAVEPGSPQGAADRTAVAFSRSRSIPTSCSRARPQARPRVERRGAAWSGSSRGSTLVVAVASPRSTRSSPPHRDRNKRRGLASLALLLRSGAARRGSRFAVTVTDALARPSPPRLLQALSVRRAPLMYHPRRPSGRATRSSPGAAASLSPAQQSIAALEPALRLPALLPPPRSPTRAST